MDFGSGMQLALVYPSGRAWENNHSDLTFHWPSKLLGLLSGQSIPSLSV